MSKTVKLSLLTVAFLSSLHAENTITLAPLDVTSTAIKTDELRSTDAVEIYTQEDIEKTHSKDIYEFLGKHSSVIAMPTFGNPFAQKLDMHGYGIGDGYQNIVITLNGRKLNNVDMVPALLASISPSSISRIEIIKSSGIVVAGDGANAGVINIITKKNNDKSFSMYAGTYGLWDTSFYAGHSDEKLSVSASGEAKKSNGIRYTDDQGNKDANKLTIANLDISYQVLEELELRAGVNIANTDVLYASSLTKEQYEKDPTQKSDNFYSSVHQTYDTNAVNLGLSWFINDKLSFNIDGAQERKESNYLTYELVSNYDYDSAKATLEYEDSTLSIITGIDIFNGLRETDATAWSPTNQTQKDNIAGFIMANFNFGSSSLKAGYRYEKVTYEFKDETQNNKANHKLDGIELGYNFMIDKDMSLFANYSHSYQAPDIDRFFKGGEFNSFIKPSEANNYTLGFNHITATNKFKISAYYIDLKDEIYYYKDSINPWWSPNNTSANTNIDKSSKYGLDLYDNWLITDEFNIALNYNYVVAEIDKEMGRNGENYAGKDLPGVSNHNVKATLSYLPNKQTTISITEVYRSKAYAANDFNNDFTQRQEAYNTTDISATYAEKTWEVFAKINNLFNQENGLWIEDDSIYPVNFTTTALVGFKLKY